MEKDGVGRLGKKTKRFGKGAGRVWKLLLDATKGRKKNI